MKLFLLVTVFLFSILNCNASDKCVFITKDKLCAQISWTDGPYIGSFSKNIVKFKDLNEKNTYRSPKGSIQFFGWMKMLSHEHPTRPVETQILGEGIYENSKIFYMGGMKGTWLFKVRIGSEEFILHSLDV